MFFVSRITNSANQGNASEFLIIIFKKQFNRSIDDQFGLCPAGMGARNSILFIIIIIIMNIIIIFITIIVIIKSINYNTAINYNNQ